MFLKSGILLAVFTFAVEANENKELEVFEARGKAKFALLTNLAILLAAKVGLFKICVGIALVIASMKFLVIMAWSLAIFKYVPDPYIYYKSNEYQKSQFHFDPYDPHRHGQVYGPNHGDFAQNWFSQIAPQPIHFFYVVATKLFVLKMVYGAIFYALICKGWHFLTWFIHYLKEKKHYKHNHGYGHDHYGHDHNGHDHYGHDHYGHDHYGQDSGYDSYAPSAYDKNGEGGDSGLKSYKKIIYDSDGSYSVKGKS